MEYLNSSLPNKKEYTVLLNYKIFDNFQWQSK